MEILQRDQIKTFLPHREPMLLVDDVTMEGDTAIAHYHVRGDEYFLQGHFPGNPIVPGVILCEIMAQSCSIIVKDEIPGNMTLYAGLDKVRFKNSVKPGDVCEVTAKLNDRRGTGATTMFFCSAKLEVDGKLCCKGELTFVLKPQP